MHLAYLRSRWRVLTLGILLILGGFFVFHDTQAATGINRQINFQGKVVNTDGTNVANASYTFLFCIYTTATPATACTAGADNDAVWRESKSITVTDGVFQTNLGDGATPLPGSVDFNTDNIYLGLNFNANGQMTPLVRFTAVPYAFNADKVHGLTVTDTTGTLTIANAKTFTVNNTLTLSGTDSTSFTFPSTSGGTVLTSNVANQTLTGALTFDPTTTGTFLDFILETQWTAGDLMNADWGSAVTQTTALTGFNLDFTNLTSVAGSTTYGILLNDLAAQTSSTEYGIYQEGTNWDFGLYVEDAAHFNSTVNVASILDARGDVSDSTGNLTLNDAIDVSGLLTATSGVSVAAGQSYTGAGAVTLSSGGSSDLTLDSASGRVIVATGDFLKTSVSGVSGAAAGDIWYDTAASKYKINEAGTTKTLCNTTDAGCGAGGSTAWDAIGDPAGNGAIALGTTEQTMDWDFTTTAHDGLIFNFDNNGGTAGTDNGIVINNAVSTNSSGDVDTENLLLLQQLDTTGTGTTDIDNFIKIDVAANAGATDGIEITNTGGNLTNGINIADNGGGTITTAIAFSGTFTNLFDIGGTNLSTTEVSLLDGKTGTLIDDTDLTSGDGAGGTSSGSGMEAGTGGIGLLQGCSANQILKWNEASSIWACGSDVGANGIDVQAFTSTGDSTWTKPANFLFARVLVVGAGGGGGAADSSDGSSTQGGGGGGGGGYSEEWFTNGTLSATETATVGTGGTAGADPGGTGGTGGTSGFGPATNYLEATGGVGGIGVSQGAVGFVVAGGAGGAGSNGNININGGAGMPGSGVGTVSAFGGTGGASYIGSGAVAPVLTAAGATAGTAGVAKGAGGSGGVDINTTTGVAGGAGANGTVIVYSYTGSGADLAELYSTNDINLKEGDVVSLDPELQSGVKKSDTPYDRKAVGIVSSKPGIVIGDHLDEGVKVAPIALAGRVPVRVSVENGPIQVGDLLTSSATSGVAMKATKAGRVIGTAMSSFDDDEEGMVLAFLDVGYAQGASLTSLLPGLTAASDMAPVSYADAGKALLGQFVGSRDALAATIDLSDIVADRIAAGLEIVAPKVTTQALTADSITSSLTSKVAFQLTPDGEIVIGEAGKEPTSRIDVAGNATFAGVVTAGTIRAERIEGLEIFTNSIQELSVAQAELVRAVASGQSDNTDNTATLSLEVQSNSEDDAQTSELIKRIKTLEWQQAAVVDMKVVQTLIAEGGIIIGGPAQFDGNSVFMKLASFMDRVVFRGQVEFDQPPLMSVDTAGLARIKKGADRVEVRFSGTYPVLPIVSTTLLFEMASDKQREAEMDYFEHRYAVAVTRVTTKGFTLLLNQSADRDVMLSWTALAVPDPKVFESGESEEKEAQAPSGKAEASEPATVTGDALEKEASTSDEAVSVPASHGESAFSDQSSGTPVSQPVSSIRNPIPESSTPVLADTP